MKWINSSCHILWKIPFPHLHGFGKVSYLLLHQSRLLWTVLAALLCPASDHCLWSLLFYTWCPLPHAGHQHSPSCPFFSQSGINTWLLLKNYRWWGAITSQTRKKLNVKYHFPKRLLGVGNGNLLKYSCLENFMDRGPWWVTVHGVTKSWTWLSTHTMAYIGPIPLLSPKGRIQKFSLKKEEISCLPLTSWSVWGEIKNIL